MRRLLLPVIALALGAGVARADDLLYVGAGLTRNDVKDIASTASDFNTTSWKVLAGFRPISWFAAEADYIDLGSETAGFSNGASAHLEYKAFAGYAVGFVPLPVPYADVFGKVGLARWSSSGSNVSLPGNFFSISDNGTEFAWGIGGQAHFGSLGVRLEYESFSIPNTNGANVFSLDVMLSFL
jgi:hypothetical protein